MQNVYEPAVTDANAYVKLAEQHAGEQIPRKRPLVYPWGHALRALNEELEADCFCINLETTITRSETPDTSKSIQYRMSPENAYCISNASVDAAVVANNHSLDWKMPGLADTLTTLQQLQVPAVGASSQSKAEADAPVRIPLPQRLRHASSHAQSVLIHAAAHGSSGTPNRWAAAVSQGGVSYLPSLGIDTAHSIANHINKSLLHTDISIFSLHVSGNWVCCTKCKWFYISSMISPTSFGMLHKSSSDTILLIASAGIRSG